MAEPYDVYADLASINVTANGVTLLLLRSLPVSAGADPDGSLVLDEAHPSTVDRPNPTSIKFELVARIRVNPQFAVQLRDLLARTIDQMTAPDEVDQVQSSPDSAASLNGPSPSE